MGISRRSLLGCALGVAGGALYAGSARYVMAQGVDTFPGKPMRIIVPFSVGGPTDVVCRLIGGSLASAWGQSVVVENRTGAAGAIGVSAVAKSAPDGYTLGMIVPGHTIMGAMSDNVPFDITRDFSPISLVMRNPKIIVVNPQVPASNLKELLELVSQDPARYGAYGTSGVGSRAHVGMAHVSQMAKANFVHVPYPGGAAVVANLVGGQLPVAVLDQGTVLAQMKAGKIKVIAGTGAKRSPMLPDVPTVAETFPGFEATEWYGLVAPAGVPAGIVDKIYHQVKRWIESDEAKAFAMKSGTELVGSTPDELRQFVLAETSHFAKLVPTLNITK